MVNARTHLSRKLRNNPTNAEKYLWYILRLGNLGVKFRRQEPVGSYIVDFVCYERKLIIEVDGGQHNNSEDDKTRDSWLQSQNFKILRFWNHEIMANRDGVAETIIQQLASPPPQPSPQGGGN